MSNTEKNYNDLVIQYQYEIKFVMPSGKTFDANRMVNVVKGCNYENGFLTTYVFHVLVHDMYMRLIYDNQSSLMVYIKISKVIADSDDPLNPSEIEVILEETMLPVFHDLPADYTSRRTIITEDMLGYEKEKNIQLDFSDYNMKNVQFVAFNIDALIANKELINNILVSCNTGTALGYIIHTISGIEQALVDMPDNEIVYKEIVLLPHNLRRSIHNLQRRYGIYSKGVMAFMDNKLLYVLKKYEINHSQIKGKPNFTQVNINSKSAVIPKGDSIREDIKSGVKIYNSYNSLMKDNKQVILGEVTADITLFSSFDKIANFLSVKKNKIVGAEPLVDSLIRGINSHANTSSKIEIDYDMLNNPFNIVEQNAAQSVGNRLTIDIRGVDVDSFTPEKYVYLEVIDDELKNKDYSGNYVIENVTFVFSPSTHVSTETFKTISTAMVTLCKVIAEEDAK